MRKINLSRWALENQPLVRYLLAVFIFAGVAAFFSLGQEEDPPFVFRGMVVRAYWPGATAMQMGQQVADPIEKVIQEIPYAYKIRSYSKPGETVIFLQLDDSAPPRQVADIWYTTRKRVSDMAGTLPRGVVGPFFNDEFGDTFGVLLAFSADGFKYAELKDFVTQVRQEMLKVPDVAKVQLFGVQPEKVFIDVSHYKIAQLGISAQDIFNQINSQNVVTSQGVLSLEEQKVWSRVQGQFESIEDLANLPIRAGKNTLLLKDIAHVHRGYQDPPVSKMRFNGKEVIGLGISMVNGGDIIRLGQELEKVERRILAELPVGIELQRVADQPKSVSTSVNEFVKVLIEAIVIVLAVSFLSLGLHSKPFRIDTRPGLVVALTIPLVLALTFLAMSFFNINLHKISLGALIIALGLLVDDAIIAVEMMVRKLEEGYSRFDAAIFAYDSTAIPMLTGTLITAAGFLPIALAQSAAGEYTYSIFAVTAIALVLSWFVAVIFVPYIGYWLLKKPKDGQGHTEVFDTPFYQRFRHWIEVCVNHRWITISVTVLAFIGGGYSFKFIEQQFFPDSNRLEIMVNLWLPEGTAFEETEKQAIKLEQWLAKQPEVQGYASFVGDGAPRFYLSLDQKFVQSNLAELIVIPKTFEDREILRGKLKAHLEGNFPDIRPRITLLPNGPPVTYPVQFVVQGPDPRVVRVVADKVKEAVASSEYTRGTHDNWNENIKVMKVEVDQARARALGVSSQSIAESSHVILSGVTIGQYRENNRLIDIVFRNPESERDTLAELMNANVPTASGAYVPLSQVGNVTMSFEPGVIWREGGEFGITVKADVVSGIQGTTVALAMNKALDPLRAELPLGVSVNLDGLAADSGKAQQSIMANVPLMLFIVLTLLMLQLKSFGRTLLVYFTGPLGIIGAALALIITARPFGFVAQLGVIALFGMIIRNSVILVDQIEQDRAAGVDPYEAIIGSTIRRSRPILLTAAAAVLAMIPLMRSQFWGPMAVAIMGGLIVATLLTLFFLPALYAAAYRIRKPKL
ncbi:MAG: efflux RND transporter permease subunit [Limnobacter sp.]|jgi:multidrug efflux pump|uniref:Efflux RND transporter permease subunit n=2 Tax=Pseudomonadota TaxID=1224 RepID=A0ABX6N8X3_9BURK|nr:MULTISPECIES: efflux RND transporter permease subunit [unclassified Limnobacter]MDZ4048982.1 efflux RND transporter permease subunit [Limnobacter sp.]QJR29827.1 efflux RND transporter permease subunit [Limnobacter sp. SAORIC-580]RZO94336.1 MAG: efflux RND transporter permease subunit [Limnobacter sp.]